MASILLINKVKQTAWIYNIYYYVGSLMVNILKMFLKTDEKLILFVSYGGKKYDDSPKDIYIKMLNDCRFDDYKIIWAFRRPENFEIGRGGKIKIDTFQYYKLER